MDKPKKLKDMTEGEKEGLRHKRTGTGYFYLHEILDELIGRYYLEPGIKDTLRHKVEKVCQGIFPGEDGEDLWLKTMVLEDGRKKATHKFLPEEKELLLDSAGLLKYLHGESTKPDRLDAEETQRREDAEAAEETMRRQREVLENSIGGGEEMMELKKLGEDQNAPSYEEVKALKMEFMLEALFLKFFTPIDENRLRDDMQLRESGTGYLDCTAETEGAARRLKDGRNYYRERKWAMPVYAVKEETGKAPEKTAEKPSADK